jgi:PadR family transcriptional regulator, regulatory protein AphA
MLETTTTGYVMLALLSTQDRTGYDLAEQVGRGTVDIWSRADRQRYKTPKRLVELGFVTARSEPAGRRPRTVYAITDAGRAALRDWLAQPPKPPTMDFEGLVRVLVGDQGTIGDLRQDLEATAASARDTRAVYVAHAEFILATEGGTFPDRQHLFALANQYMVEHCTQIIDWATWALTEIEDWPDTTSPSTTHAARIRAIYERALEHRA